MKYLKESKCAKKLKDIDVERCRYLLILFMEKLLNVTLKNDIIQTKVL